MYFFGGSLSAVFKGSRVRQPSNTLQSWECPVQGRVWRAGRTPLTLTGLWDPSRALITLALCSSAPGQELRWAQTLTQSGGVPSHPGPGLEGQRLVPGPLEDQERRGPISPKPAVLGHRGQPLRPAHLPPCLGFNENCPCVAAHS